LPSLKRYALKLEKENHMNAYIVTGTTRGLGRALVEVICEIGQLALTLSSAADQIAGGQINVRTDLTDLDSLPAKLDILLHQTEGRVLEALVLINNAGRLDPIMPLAHAQKRPIAEAFKINLTAPAIIMAHFIRSTAALTLPRRIINISSGAATSPYAGWGCYCSSKAGLAMLTRCVAQEQAMSKNPVKVCAVAPGVIDTDMQRQVRETSVDNFPRRQKFLRLHAEDSLAAPISVARRILDLDAGGQFEQGGLHDLREMPLLS
jgi:benzil reductase ((S)-benzoin forming)